MGGIVSLGEEATMTVDQESWWAGFKAGFESDRIYTVAIAVSAFCAGFMWGLIYD